MNHLRFSVLLIATLLFTSSITTVNSATIATVDSANTATITTVDSAIAAATTTTVSMAPSPSLGTFGCDARCGKRCAKAGYKERCLKYCGICCEKCEGCVPSSPEADKAECPCYRDLKNSKGKDKCP